MNTFKLTIASPDGNKFSDEAQMLTVRGIEGDLAIMAGHIPFITALQPCDCKIVLPDGTEKSEQSTVVCSPSRKKAQPSFPAASNGNNRNITTGL